MEHRKTSRRIPSREEPLSRIRLRTGREMSVVDVSNSGLLAEGPVRLLPGTHVDVHVVARDGRVLVRSRVVRCWIAALQADAVSYRAALAFERCIDAAPPQNAMPGADHDAADTQGPDYPSPLPPASLPAAEPFAA
jgi:hypothetical protein